MKLIWSALLAVLFCWGITLVIDPPAVADVWFFRKQAILLTGTASFVLMSLIMVLAIRPVWLEKLLQGMDKIYQAHKWAGILAIVLGLTHYFLELGGPLLSEFFLRPEKTPRPDTILSFLRSPSKTVGEWSMWFLGGMLLLTLWHRFPYHLWRYLHKLLGGIYLLLAFHSVVLSPPGYWSQPIGALIALCTIAGSVCALISIFGRIGQSRTYKGVISQVERLNDDTLELTCTLPSRWSHEAGQFAFLVCDHIEGAHPFTISSADQGTGEVRFAIKALGDYTHRLQSKIQPGDTVKVEGPYGCFDYRRSTAQKQIWIAGGIGVTPFVAWLESMLAHAEETPEIELYYCTRNVSEAIFAERLAELSRQLPKVTLHIHYSEQKGHFDASFLYSSLQQDNWPSIWFCGPEGLASGLRKDLRGFGMPMRYFHQEAFQMR